MVFKGSQLGVTSITAIPSTLSLLLTHTHTQFRPDKASGFPFSRGRLTLHPHSESQLRQDKKKVHVDDGEDLPCAHAPSICPVFSRYLI